MFYSYNENSQREISGIDALSYLIDVVGGATYQFHVRAVTIKPGPNATLTVNVPEYGMKTSFSILDNEEVNVMYNLISWRICPYTIAKFVENLMGWSLLE